MIVHEMITYHPLAERGCMLSMEGGPMRLNINDCITGCFTFVTRIIHVYVTHSYQVWSKDGHECRSGGAVEEVLQTYQYIVTSSISQQLPPRLEATQLRMRCVALEECCRPPFHFLSSLKSRGASKFLPLACSGSV